MSFAEVKVFQVLPDQLETFKKLSVRMTEFQKSNLGCKKISYLWRFYTFDDGIQDPPRPLKKVVGAVKYLSFWKFDRPEQYHSATRDDIARFEKQPRKLLKATFVIHCGYTLEEKDDD